MNKKCADCNDTLIKPRWNAVYCPECRAKHYRQDTYSPKHASSVIVRYAVRGGILPKLDGSINCVDCDKKAVHYDHRDYLKPLDVSPVCHSCNLNRGKGINSEHKVNTPSV